jgi:diguanylate cyclase (GGDEF)-like protein/PAS domain S-box-containing protein/putative nucleotidyltransferase with HDIG domain
LQGWGISDNALHLAVLVSGGIVVVVLGCLWPKGRYLGYVTVAIGLFLVASSRGLNLVVGSSADVPPVLPALELALSLAGHLVALAGLVFWILDLRQAAAATQSRLTEQESSAQKAQTSLRLERDLLQGVVESGELFIVGMSPEDQRITLFNCGAERISGYSRDEVVGRQFPDLFLPADQRDGAWLTLPCGASGQEAGATVAEMPLRTKSGQTRILSWTCTLRPAAAGCPSRIVVFGQDVTGRAEMRSRLELAKAELERANQELERLATTDYLTGLVNRRQAIALFEHELRRSQRQATPIGVVMIDLDQFKAVNDSCGHEAGDEVLRHVAQLLRGGTRASDIVARHGGEEFLLILPDTDLSGAICVAENVRRRIRDYPARYANSQIPARASLGVASLERGQTLSAHDLIRMADEALYKAKGLGGNRVITWQMVQEGEVEPSLAGTDEVRQVERHITDLTKANNNAFLDSLYRLVESLEGRIVYTAHHSSRVARYSVAIAEEMGLKQEQVDLIYRSAMLHDVGKVAVPDSVLWKNDILSRMDWALVRQHPAASVQIIGKLEFLRREAGIIRHHHERPDGKGYPDGLHGEAIPPEARVLAVADALDAMTRDRPHRAALSLEEALGQLQQGEGTQFDPRAAQGAMAAAKRAGDWPLADSAPLETPAVAAE